MSSVFHAVLYQPIFNAFIALYAVIPDTGVAIFLLTVIVKALLWPLTGASIRAQKSMQELQPKIEALKKEFKDDQQKLAQETMKVYREHKVNPLGSCLPILIQIPVFLALYWVLRDGLASDNFSLLYPFVPNPGHLNPVSFGVLDLQKGSGWESGIIALLAGAAQYIQAKDMIKKRPPPAVGAGGKDEDMMAMMNKQMLYMMPALTVFIGWQLPAGLSLYWLFSTVLTVAQQRMIGIPKSKE